MTHPSKGYCYNIDGHCEGDHCRCWDDGEEVLKKKLDSHREMLKEAGVDWDRLAENHFKKLIGITCACNDSSCERRGQEGEVAGHIENCSCHTCHHAMGKLN
jgi:hypothetical protein